MQLFRLCAIGTFSALSFFVSLVPLSAQQPSKLNSVDLDHAHVMLRQAYKDVKNNYYDPAFHGVDLDATYHQYDTKLDSAHTLGESFRIIAAFLSHLHDSHTFFLPPQRVNQSTSGFHMQMVGDTCLITQVRPKTDAADKLHVGDQILTFNGFNVGRVDFHDLQYFFRVLSPAAAVQLNLQDPSGARREETVNIRYLPGKAVLDVTGRGSDNDLWDLIRQNQDNAYNNRGRFVEEGDVIIWKIPQFFVDPVDINSVFSKAKKHKTLILDLRGNPGGSIEILKEVLAHLFDHEVKLGDRVSRKESKQEMVKGLGDGAFKGKVIVLIDSQSASAAEILARIVQLEHRGFVIGDRSEGAVMESRHYSESMGADTRIFYGFSITSANLLMADGASLEGTGVMPDELMLPTASDLAEGRDPVLSHAMELGGEKIDPAAAGKLFPFEWPDI